MGHIFIGYGVTVVL